MFFGKAANIFVSLWLTQFGIVGEHIKLWYLHTYPHHRSGFKVCWIDCYLYLN